ncbi:MAG: hypothetical protein DRP11_00290 [Candidatus Aenigmatarchaeota archaeon]|nr:MAG: hypothetical protein DRP11_00290 [Candidatus Aenigmarchaeota archaeon]
MINHVLFLIERYDTESESFRYVHEVSKYLRSKGIESHLICFSDKAMEIDSGFLKVHTVPFLLHGDNFFNWMMLVNIEFVRKIRELLEVESFDLVNSVDWVTIPAGTAGAKLLDVPLVVTFNSIEHERGMDKMHSFVISDLEWDGANEANAVIVRKKSTSEAIKVFRLDPEKVFMIQKPEDVLKVYEKYMKVKA